jgi:hypothetical protein
MRNGGREKRGRGHDRRSGGARRESKSRTRKHYRAVRVGTQKRQTARTRTRMRVRRS